MQIDCFIKLTADANANTALRVPLGTHSHIATLFAMKLNWVGWVENIDRKPYKVN